MHYTYLLLSQQDQRFYTACSSDLRKRVREPPAGRARSTGDRPPVKLIYNEACLSREDALGREGFLKTGKGSDTQLPKGKQVGPALDS